MNRRERWRPLPPLVGTEFENYYEVSDRGRVRSLDRVVEFDHGLCGRLSRKCHGQMIRIHVKRVRTHYGFHYQRTVMVWLGTGKHESAHFIVARIVYEAFVGKIPEGMSVIHKNRRWKRDRPDELALATTAERQNSDHRKPNIPAFMKHCRPKSRNFKVHIARMAAT